MDDAVCPGSGHGDFPAIMAAPREIGFDGYLMLEGFGYLAAERNSRGAFFFGGGIFEAEIGASYCIRVISLIIAIGFVL